MQSMPLVRHILGDEALQEIGDVLAIFLRAEADDRAGKQAFGGHG